ncbi:MAG: AAA family ATPase, partial [Thermoplasmatota archaeon]
MVVILLTGMPGSGKEEFLKVARKNNINIIRMGDVVRKIADEYEISSKNISVGQFAHQE